MAVKGDDDHSTFVLGGGEKSKHSGGIVALYFLVFVRKKGCTLLQKKLLLFAMGLKLLPKWTLFSAIVKKMLKR